MRSKHIQCFMIIISGLALLGAGLIIAEAGENDLNANKPGFIEHFDKDGDDLVAEDEFPGSADQFTQMDQDGDGFISAPEASAQRPQGRPMGFEQDDADQDGKVSASEFSGPEDLFNRLDANDDGYLTREEARPRRGHHGRPESTPDQVTEP
ncbi:MAG: hypothetical protein FP816_02415 [Desulfobacteraceae bacterium]|nr:hypothetical protein [Desulfobacteraceae bacterium]